MLVAKLTLTSMLQTITITPAPLPPLTDLVDQINAAHDRCTQACRAALFNARQCGDLLIEAKKQVGHGNWEAWVVAHCTFSDRTASRWMRVAREWDKLEELEATDLSITDAMRLLSDSADSEVVDADFVEQSKSDTHDGFVPADLQVGDRALVIKVGHLHFDDVVDVLERRSGLYLCELPSGQTYLFMPTELRKIEALEPEPTDERSPVPPRKPSQIEMLKGLLEQVYQAIGHHLNGDLLDAVEHELGYK